MKVADKQTSAERRRFWNSFLLAVEAEPRDAREIRGASGLVHPAVAVGVDDIRRRIVVVSGEREARAAALAQYDIQAANPTYKVAMARPVSVNLSEVAKGLAAFFQSSDLGPDEWPKFQLLKNYNPEVQSGDPVFVTLAQSFEAGLRFEAAVLGILPYFQDVLQQLSHLAVDWKPDQEGATVPASTIHLDSLIQLDPVGLDIQLGNCGVPLYEFEAPDVEALQDGHDIERVRDILRRIQLLQYFFPAPDHLLLAFAEKGSDKSSLSQALAQAPLIGHPFGECEILRSNTRIDKLISSLHDRKLLVEGEFSFELSEQGQTVRSSVRFKPREGFLAKLSRVLSAKIDINLKNLFK